MSVPATCQISAKERANLFEKTVFTVDDSATVVLQTKNELISCGFKNVVTETNSTNVLNVIREIRPEIILLDIFMPLVSGLDILAELRNSRDFDDALVLMLSSADAETMNTAMHLGAMGFINKPLSRAVLMNTILATWKLVKKFE